MAVNIPTECPTCALGGIRSTVKLYQVNFEEAAVLCENQNCPFPLFSLDKYPLTIPRPVAGISECGQWKKSATDTDSISSSYSVSSWASQDSTISNVSSTMATPPPNISGRPVLSQVAPIYYPKAVMPNHTKLPYNWTTPVGSAQTSPALSVNSVTDKEVEAVMTNFCSVNQTPDLTPSPSPQVDKRMDHGLDDFDSFIADAFSTFVNHTNEPTVRQVEEKSTSTLRDAKKTPTASQLFPSVEKIQKHLAASRTASEPSRKRPANALQVVKTVASPRPPQSTANQSQVALQVNEQGTAVFTIVPPSPKVAKTETAITEVSPLSTKSSIAAKRATSGIGLKRSTVAAKSSRQSIGKLTPINAIVNQFLKSTHRRPFV